jgi:hypothetical protein
MNAVRMLGLSRHIMPVIQKLRPDERQFKVISAVSCRKSLLYNDPVAFLNADSRFS